MPGTTTDKTHHSINEDENTGFYELLEKLSKYIDDSGISLDIRDELDEARESLLESKRHYFQMLLLYNEVRELLFESNYGIHDEKYEEQNNDNTGLRLLSERFFTNESKYCLNISSQATSDCAENLFGLSYEDMELESTQKKLVQQAIQQTAIPVLEKRLKKKSLTLYKFCNPNHQDSEGLALAKANQLATTVSNEQKKFAEQKKILKQEKKNYNDIFMRQYKKLASQLDDLETTLNNVHTKPRQETTKVTVDWLAAKCDYILSKIIVMKNHVYDETYTKETIEALSKIRTLLDDEIVTTKKELDRTKKTIHVYESIGDDFTNLLNEYRQITMQIDNKKWALSELQKDSSETAKRKLDK